MNKKTKRSSYKSRGGALYTFDLKDNVGGLPAVKSLNGTPDGDCPYTNDDFLKQKKLVGGSKSKRSSRRSSRSKRSSKSKRSSRKH